MSRRGLLAPAPYASQARSLSTEPLRCRGMLADPGVTIELADDRPCQDPRAFAVNHEHDSRLRSALAVQKAPQDHNRLQARESMKVDRGVRPERVRAHSALQSRGAGCSWP